jgi:hypothetical protein
MILTNSSTILFAVAFMGHEGSGALVLAVATSEWIVRFVEGSYLESGLSHKSIVFEHRPDLSDI